MTSKATTPQQYLKELPTAHKEAVEKLRDLVVKTMPKGLKEEMSYGALGYVVPHSIYPAGYHCNPKLPLPFVSIASQKKFIGFYHMGIYADPSLLKWFTTEYPKHSTTKLDMGKSCIRFNKPEQIPYKLIEQLMKKMTVQNWIDLYESGLKK